MARRRADVRREEILLAAASVVSRLGFARTRVQDVAAELGVSTALVFYHFETKERLLSEAFDVAARRDLERLDRAVAGRGSAVQRLRAVLRMYQPTGDAQGWTRDIDAWAEGVFSEEIRDACRRIEVRWRSALARVVEDGVAGGEFRCKDPAEAALRIVVMMDGLGVATQVRGTLNRTRAARWAAEYAAEQLGIPAQTLLTPNRGLPTQLGHPAPGAVVRPAR